MTWLREQLNKACGLCGATGGTWLIVDKGTEVRCPNGHQKGWQRLGVQWHWFTSQWREKPDTRIWHLAETGQKVTPCGQRVTWNDERPEISRTMVIDGPPIRGRTCQKCSRSVGRQLVRS